MEKDPNYQRVVAFTSLVEVKTQNAKINECLYFLFLNFKAKCIIITCTINIQTVLQFQNESIYLAQILHNQVCTLCTNYSLCSAGHQIPSDSTSPAGKHTWNFWYQCNSGHTEGLFLVKYRKVCFTHTHTHTLIVEKKNKPMNG